MCGATRHSSNAAGGGWVEERPQVGRAHQHGRGGPPAVVAAAGGAGAGLLLLGCGLTSIRHGRCSVEVIIHR